MTFTVDNDGYRYAPINVMPVGGGGRGFKRIALSWGDGGEFLTTDYDILTKDYMV